VTPAVVSMFVMLNVGHTATTCLIISMYHAYECQSPVIKFIFRNCWTFSIPCIKTACWPC